MLEKEISLLGAHHKMLLEQGVLTRYLTYDAAGTGSPYKGPIIRRCWNREALQGTHHKMLLGQGVPTRDLS